MARTTRNQAAKRPVFLEALAAGLMVADAAKVAGVHRCTVYNWRSADKQFAAEWDEAYRQGAIVLEAEARRRAVDGVRRYLYHQGQPIIAKNPVTGDPEHAYELNYSDTLLMMLLKARDPERFDDRVRLARIMRRWADEDGKAGAGATVPADSVIALLAASAARKAAETEPLPPPSFELPASGV